MHGSLTIAISSFQRRQHLSNLLDSIRKALEEPIDAEVDVVVVLDGSTDGSEELIAQAARSFPVPVHTVWKVNGGLASARNAAIDHTDSSIVWLVDDDMTVTRQALQHHLGHDRSVAPVLMGPCVVPSELDGSEMIRAFYDLRHTRLAGSGEVVHAADCSFANTSAPLELFRRYPFDEGYRGYGMEDYDLGARLIADRHRIAFAPDAAIAHHATPSRQERLGKLRQEGENRLRFVRRHPHLRSAAFATEPTHFERVMRVLARPLMTQPLWAVANGIERAITIFGIQHHRSRLEDWADTSAVYSGVAAAARTQDVTISVVIPAHDAASTIDAVLKNLANQTSPSWEALVVDDGSTDRTAEIVQCHAMRDSRIRLVHQAHGGVAAARNTGRAAAQSPWLLFLDADDRLAETFIDRMQRALRANRGTDGVRCNWAYELADGRTEVVRNVQLDQGQDLFDAAAERSPFAIHSCVIRASLVDQVGGFDEGLRVGEDWDLWQRIGRAGARVVSVPDVLSFYVLHSDSAMRRDSRGALLDSLSVYRRVHSPDSRVVRPVDRHRHGAPLPIGRDLVAEHVAWEIGVCLATETEVTAALSAHTPPNDTWLDPSVVAGTLYEAIPFGCCALTADWPGLWALHAARIERSVDEFGRWSGHPYITEPTLRHLEYLILLCSHDREPMSVGASLGMHADLGGTIAAVELHDEVWRVIARVFVGHTPIGIVELPALGAAVDRDQINAGVRRQLGARFLRLGLRRPQLAAGIARAFGDRVWLSMPARLVMDMPLHDPQAARDIATRFLHALASRATASSPLLANATGTHAPSSDHTEDASNGPHHRTDHGTEYFEDIFSVEDPWCYTSPYEETKYQQTLELLQGLRVGKALELACAEGHFTTQLAQRVDQLIAADISPTALARAAKRCEHLATVEFQLIDVRTDPLPSQLDLIVCSEVLYFLDDESALRSLAGRLTAALNPGGHLVTAHAAVTRDNPDSTGFPWERPFGAARIGEILGDTEGLRLHRELVTPLYRIQLFERSDTPGPPPVVEHGEHAVLDRQMHRSIAWGGVAITRADAMADEITNRVPILMYHRVADSGAEQLDRYRVDPAMFEQQLDHLRRNGYYGVTAARWAIAVDQRRALPGRAVMLTFDDGYCDFLDHAFPLLDAYGFPATVFVVPDHVGGSAEWDARFAPPAPLLSWPQIRQLAGQGVEFGCHSGAHVPLSDLAPRAALEQEQRARRRLHEELGHPVTAIAYPFGVHDAVVRATMEAAGYQIGFTSDSGFATVWDDPMAFPRIEVRGEDDLDAFAAKLPRPSRRNPLHATLERTKVLARRVTTLR
jgi:glycosyltransferase involved in cell wall biosynthesis/peptidoglycan/xylan/chitin deacetylase (PgdA/CDA1 family)